MNTALQKLAALELDSKRRQYPNIPDNGIVKPKFSDKTANGLTYAIIRCIELYDGYWVRINTQGQYNEKLDRWTKGTTRKGTADVHGLVNGMHLSIEIKIGRDAVSEAQKQTAQSVIKAGGIYFVARNFESFYSFFEAYILILPKPQTALYYQRHPIPHLATPDFLKPKIDQ